MIISCGRLALNDDDEIKTPLTNSNKMYRSHALQIHKRMTHAKHNNKISNINNYPISSFKTN